MASESTDYLLQQLSVFTEEHFALNQLIDDNEQEAGLDQLLTQRLKKRKLFLKDKIREIQSMLYPDIIA
ncbi:MAG: DUF465 domain-containing protein [Pseudomonadota bacterium]